MKSRKTKDTTKNERVFEINISDLKLHPISKKIYDYTSKEALQAIKSLAVTMELKGQLEPITINPNNEIISGGRRYKAAFHLGWKKIKAIKIPISKNVDQERVIHNQQRKKTVQEIINEAEIILGLLGKNQGQRNDLLKDSEDKPFGEIGQDRFELAAMIIGDISGTTLRRLMKIVEFENKSKQNKELRLVKRIIKDGMAISSAEYIMNSYLQSEEEANNFKNNPIKDHYSTNDYKLYKKSSARMKESDESIQVVFTSPPYYDLRNYGNSKKGNPELGLENTPEEYINNLSIYLREVKRVLKKEGSFFLNIGDTIKNGKSLLIPERLLINLCSVKEGWHCVNKIIWVKTNPKPQKNKRKLQPSYEMIFHLVKDIEYFYKEFKICNHKQVRITKGPLNRSSSTTKRRAGRFTITSPFNKFNDFIYENKVRDVISGPNGSVRQKELKETDPKADHPALMPSYLPVIPLLTTSKIGDTILDPFSGSATTGKTALLLGRKYIGYELNEKNYKLSVKNLTQPTKPIKKKKKLA